MIPRTHQFNCVRAGQLPILLPSRSTPQNSYHQQKRQKAERYVLVAALYTRVNVASGRIYRNEMKKPRALASPKSTFTSLLTKQPTARSSIAAIATPRMSQCIFNFLGAREEAATSVQRDSQAAFPRGRLLRGPARKEGPSALGRVGEMVRPLGRTLLPPGELMCFGSLRFPRASCRRVFRSAYLFKSILFYYFSAVMGPLFLGLACCCLFFFVFRFYQDGAGQNLLLTEMYIPRRSGLVVLACGCRVFASFEVQVLNEWIHFYLHKNFVGF